MIVYKITNNITGLVYIGQTKLSLNARWTSHCNPHSGCIYLKRAIAAYGKENFSKEILIEASCASVINDQEIEFIKKFNSLAPNGYNIRPGGHRSPLAPETIEKIRLAHVGKKRSAAHKEYCRQRQLGTTRTEATKLKMSLAKKGKPSKLLGRPWSAARRAAYVARFKNEDI